MSEKLTREIPILMSGLPGKMATLVAESVEQDKNFYLQRIVLSSQTNSYKKMEIQSRRVSLLHWSEWPVFFTSPRGIFDMREGTIAVDFSTPDATLENARFFVRHRIPFVMGTTGFDRVQVEDLVKNSEVNAVIAPNMALSVIKLQDELQSLIETAPDTYRGWHMSIFESHQATKRDVSGTAKAFQVQLEQLGAIMGSEIVPIRNPERQRQLGIQNLEAHAYHWITLTGPGGQKKEYETQIEGRIPYVEGTLLAARFLHRQMATGLREQVFSMRDVLKGGDSQ